MARLRLRCAALAGVVMLLGTVTGVGVASAQTTPSTYTPGTSVPAFCTGGPVDAGNVAIGQTVSFLLCGPFQPGSTVDISVDNQAAGTKTASSSGTVTVVITVNSATGSTVNDPTNVTTACGANTVSATGPGATTATATQVGTFNVICAGVATRSSNGLAFTGSNVLKAGLAALLLIVVGGALVLAQRRRRTSQAL